MAIKNKKKTIRPVLAIVLAALGSAAVGFSSWIIVSEDKLTGRVLAAEISYTQVNIFTSVSVSGESLKLGKDGIVDDHTIVTSGNYIIFISINNEVLKQSNFLDSNNIMKMRAALTDKTSGSTFFTYLSGFGAKIGNTAIENPEQETFDSTNITYFLSVPIDVTQSQSTITLTYNFSGDLSACYSKYPSLNFKVEAIA